MHSLPARLQGSSVSLRIVSFDNSESIDDKLAMPCLHPCYSFHVRPHPQRTAPVLYILADIKFTQLLSDIGDKDYSNEAF